MNRTFFGGFISFLLLLVLFGCEPKGDLTKVPAVDLSEAEPRVKAKIEQLTSALQAAPNDAENWGKLGINLFVHGFETASIPCFTEAHRLDESSFRWAYLTAFAYDELNDTQALDWYRKARKLDAAYAPLYIKEGRLLLEQGEKQFASQAFQNALAMDSLLSHAHVGLGEISFDNGDTEAAIRHLQKAIRANPRHREAYALLSSCYRKSGDLQKAQYYVTQMENLPKVTHLPEPLVNEMAKEGVSAYWYQFRGKQYLDAGQNQQAAAELKMALEIEENAETHNNLALALTKVNKAGEALKSFRRAVALKPENVLFLSNLGAFLCEVDDYEEGVPFIQKAFDLDPAHHESTLNLANYYRKKGDWAKAIGVYRKGIIADQHNSFFLYNLGWLLATAPKSALRDSDEAMTIARFLGAKSNFKDPETLDLLAAVYAEKGDFKAANGIINDAIKLAEASGDFLMVDRLKLRQERYAEKRPWRVKAQELFSG